MEQTKQLPHQCGIPSHAMTTGTATVSSGGSGVDTRVMGYSGSCDALEQIGFDDDGLGYPP